METPVQKASRLITALEELTAQETVLLRSLDLVEAVQICERAAPLVERLCVLAADPAVGALRDRITAVVDRRRQHATMLDTHLSRLQTELRRIDDARGRLMKIGPAYGLVTPPPAESRLNTAA